MVRRVKYGRRWSVMRYTLAEISVSNTARMFQVIPSMFTFQVVRHGQNNHILVRLCLTL